MNILAATSWETIVNFCNSTFDSLVSFFSHSFFVEFVKPRSALGLFDYSYAGLCFGAALLVIIGRKVIKLFVGI